MLVGKIKRRCCHHNNSSTKKETRHNKTHEIARVLNSNQSKSMYHLAVGTRWILQKHLARVRPVGNIQIVNVGF
jgi:hypothetical protein